MVSFLLCSLENVSHSGFFEISPRFSSLVHTNQPRYILKSTCSASVEGNLQHVPWNTPIIPY